MTQNRNLFFKNCYIVFSIIRIVLRFILICTAIIIPRLGTFNVSTTPPLFLCSLLFDFHFCLPFPPQLGKSKSRICQYYIQSISLFYLFIFSKMSEIILFLLIYFNMMPCYSIYVAVTRISPVLQKHRIHHVCVCVCIYTYIYKTSLYSHLSFDIWAGKYCGICTKDYNKYRFANSFSN